MLCIQLKNTNPFFCLAAEEYFLKNFSEEVFLLWQSHDTVVVGKHQNLLAEINYPYVVENKITLARRISGGGTVFHDAGNVNFALIQHVESTAEINFSRFTRPIVEALSRLGITAVSSGRNDLLVHGKKISGNAQHVYKNRVLHHGTLLFNSQLETLGKALKIVPGKYYDKAVQSNRSEVNNIAPFLKRDLTTQAFIAFLAEQQQKKPGNSNYPLEQREEEAIRKLAGEKFQTREWIYGYSPKYTFRNETAVAGKKLAINLSVEKGRIVKASFPGPCFEADEAARLGNILTGKMHTYETIRDALERIRTTVPAELIFSFF